jgi:hypothetical protein
MKTVTLTEIRFDGIHCKLTIQLCPGGVVVLRIAGTDVGEFGEEPMKELNQRLAVGDPIDLYIDAREVRGASIEVSGEWARWLRAHKVHLRDVSMLTGSRYIQVTAEFVRRFSDLEGMMKVYTDERAFDDALHAALSSAAAQ